MKFHNVFRLLVAALLVSIFLGCAGEQAATQVQPAKQSIYVYSYEEQGSDKSRIVHTLFIMGDAPAGGARYTAAAFKDGARYSLATSGDGNYAIVDKAITVKAGGLDAKGTIKPNEYIDLGGKKYTFAMKM